MSDPPDILKYFHQEPVLVEGLTPNRDPDARRRTDRSPPPDGAAGALDDPFDTEEAFRGYLAGTNRVDDRVGLTTLRAPEGYVRPLLDALGRAWWGRVGSDGSVETLTGDGVRRALRTPGRTAVLVTAEAPVAPTQMAAVTGTDRRAALSALRALLDAAHVVFFPEPAHDGHDWSFWSAHPMRDRLVAAFRAHPADATRRFVLPHEYARSESKFYFDTWQLTETSRLPDYIEEV
ncbi:MAG: hypothetical protein ACLFTE_09575 [Salinivenus sp.]